MDKLTSNLGIKLLIILAAFLLWFYVSLGESKTGAFPSAIPIEIRNKPADLEPVLSQNKVNIKIGADASVWRKLTVSSFKAYVDLGDASSGTIEREVQVSSSEQNVKILEKNPAKVLVSLEQVVKKDVRVSVRIEGEAASGKVADVPIPEVETVEIAGPKSLVSKISEAVASITLKDESETFERQITLQVFDEQNQVLPNVVVTPAVIKIKVPIVQSGEIKTVGIKPTINDRPKAGFWVSSISVEPSTATISGSPDRLRQTQFIETSGISVKDLDQDKSFSVNINIPSGTKLIGNNSQAKVSISISQLESLKEIKTNLQIAGISPDLQLAGQPPAFSTLLSGPIGALQTATGKNIVATADLSGKIEGQYAIELKKDNFKTPDGVQILSYLPSSFSLTLVKK